MNMLITLTDLLTMFGILVVGLLIWAALSPLETLGWWAGWFGDKIYEDPVPSDGLLRVVHPNADGYILFLSGVGRTSSETLSRREKGFLERLAKALPQTIIIDDLFPYAANNLGLTGRPFFARLWRRALQWKLHGPRLAGNVINLRNIFQVLISADKRYGPLFNQGVAEVLMHGLLRYQYDPQSKIPVFLVASSGAAQIAVGTAPFLKELIDSPVYVVSVGGVFTSGPGLLTIDHTLHLYGTHDTAIRWAYLDLGRWPANASSNWNRARRQGKVTEVCLGAMKHGGRGGYLDAMTSLSEESTYVDKTVKHTADFIAEVTQRPLESAEGRKATVNVPT
jgi:hypothetical protein